MIIWPYEYRVESRAGRPVSLWRRTRTPLAVPVADRLELARRHPPRVGPPPPQRLAAIDTVQAVALLGDRRRWVRYWVVCRRRELGGPDHPITVIRRRSWPAGTVPASRCGSCWSGTGDAKTTAAVGRRPATA